MASLDKFITFITTRRVALADFSTAGKMNLERALAAIHIRREVNAIS